VGITKVYTNICFNYLGNWCLFFIISKIIQIYLKPKARNKHQFLEWLKLILLSICFGLCYNWSLYNFFKILFSIYIRNLDRNKRNQIQPNTNNIQQYIDKFFESKYFRYCTKYMLHIIITKYTRLDYYTILLCSWHKIALHTLLNPCAWVWDCWMFGQNTNNFN